MSDYILRCSSSNAINLPKEFIEQLGWKLNDRVSLREASVIIDPGGDNLELPILDIMKKKDQEILEEEEEVDKTHEEWEKGMKATFEIIKKEKEEFHKAQGMMIGYLLNIDTYHNRRNKKDKRNKAEKLISKTRDLLTCLQGCAEEINKGEEI